MVCNRKNPFPVKGLARFRHSEDARISIEALFWMPVSALFLAALLNLCMVFYYESRMLQVAQDATRAFSSGRLTEVEAESYIKKRLSFIQANIAVDTVKVDGVAKTVVTTTADQLLPFSAAFAPFKNILVGVSTKYKFGS